MREDRVFNFLALVVILVSLLYAIAFVQHRDIAKLQVQIPAQRRSFAAVLEHNGLIPPPPPFVYPTNENQ